MEASPDEILGVKLDLVAHCTLCLCCVASPWSLPVLAEMPPGHLTCHGGRAGVAGQVGFWPNLTSCNLEQKEKWWQVRNRIWNLNIIQAVCIFKKVLWKFYWGQLEVRYMSDLVPVIPHRKLWFVQVPDSWNCLGLEQDVRGWVEVLSHIVFLRFQSKPTIWWRTSEYTRYFLDEIDQVPRYILVPPVSNAWFYVNNCWYFIFVNFNLASRWSCLKSSVGPDPHKEFVYTSWKRRI